MNTSVNLVLYPHPTLRQKSKPIVRVDDNLLLLVARMFDIMYESRGVGLAANQVNVPLRLFVANPLGDREEGQEFAFLNPTISRQKGSEEGEEGCLSIPGINAVVKRSKSLHLSAYNLRGEEVELDCDGYLARIIQHEVDHLDGVLFVDRLNETTGRVLEPNLDILELDFESKQRTAALDKNESMIADAADWITRYA